MKKKYISGGESVFKVQRRTFFPNKSVLQTKVLSNWRWRVESKNKEKCLFLYPFGIQFQPQSIIVLACNVDLACYGVSLWYVIQSNTVSSSEKKRKNKKQHLWDRGMAEVRIDGRAHISKIPNTYCRTRINKKIHEKSKKERKNWARLQTNKTMNKRSK